MTPDFQDGSLPSKIFLFFFFLLVCYRKCTPSGKKTVTGVQVISASQVQSIWCRWQALFVLPVTEAHTSRWWARALSLT